VTTGFDEYVNAELDRLLRYTTALTGDPHLAEDIVQDVLLKARARWSRMDTPGAYLRRMIVNEYLSWRRRRGNRDVVPAQQGDLDALSEPVADHSTAYVERDEMLGRLATLPRKQCAALVLRYYENRSDEEIAAVLRCRPGTVRSQISRALATLRTTEPASASALRLGEAR
jgi:RNA polymerase sigma-70 factor (sigma-E family)